MISISEWSADVAPGDVEYRGRKVEFEFKPGLYTGEVVGESPLLVEVVATCVTAWNIEGADPTKPADVATLPWGLIVLLYRKIGELATQAEVDPKGEASAT